MKIAIIRRKFNCDGSGGGAERYAANMAERLTARGHSITVFSESFAGKEEDKFKWVKVGRPLIPSLCPTASFHKAVRKVLNYRDFDIIYSLARFYPADLVRITEQIHAEWMPISYSSLARFNPRHSGILKLEQEVFKAQNTGRLVTNSELVKNQVVSRFGYPECRIHVIRNGVDRNVFYPPVSAEERAELRRQLEVPADAKVLLFAASNFKIKGLAQAIKAVSMLPEERRANLILLVLGGDAQEPYQRQADKAGLSGNIRFAGAVTHKMRDYYAASDLLLYPSLYEPFANVCLEAAACALPVLTTSLNGSSELVRHRESGYIVDDADDVKAIASALEEFLKLDKIELEGFRKKALEASSGFDWELHAEQLEKLFQEIVREKNTNV